ncbi:MAG: tetratricopeptide repeat protein [Spirochaetes bacterium]|nr:tetratricopeptide repeat protein [Spirochaetota bacterium]
MNLWRQENVGPLMSLIILLPLVTACSRQNETVVKKLLELESPDYTTASTTEARIEELRREVKKYKSLVEEKVKATDKLLTYYRLLALAYMDRGMFGPALEALDQAIRIAPEQPGLFLYRGIAAARLAKGVQNLEERAALLSESERSYLRCLELDKNYVDAMYGLSVLYVFELGTPSKAIPLLQRLLERQQQHVGAMFLLARAFLSQGKIDDAIALYDRIISTPAAGSKREEARKLKEQVLQGALR